MALSRASIVVEFGEGVDSDESVQVEIDETRHGVSDSNGDISIPSSFNHLTDIYFNINMDFSRLKVSKITSSTNSVISYIESGYKQKDIDIRFIKPWDPESSDDEGRVSLGYFTSEVSEVIHYGNPFTGLSLVNDPGEQVYVTGNTPSIGELKVRYLTKTYKYNAIDTTDYNEFPVIIVIWVDLIL